MSYVFLMYRLCDKIPFALHLKLISKQTEDTDWLWLVLISLVNTILGRVQRKADNELDLPGNQYTPFYS